MTENEAPMFLHLRREPFEYGLLPLPHLMFTDGTATLKPVKEKFLQNSFTYVVNNNNNDNNAEGFLEGSRSLGRRVNTAGIAESLQLSEDHARVVLDTLASVLPDYGGPVDPLARASSDDVESVGADVDDLVLFLYIQTYKKLVPRTHKDAASVADVWPSTSAFDGFLATLSPLQLVRSGRRFMPSQADEEAHQLSYVQKHLPNILALLAEPSEDDNSETQVLSLERFEHLGLLLHVGERGTKDTSLSQAAPFFANSDPDMPAVPVPITQVLDWVLEHICAASEHPFEKVLGRENVSPTAGDVDFANFDSCTGSSRDQCGAFPNGPAQQMEVLHQKLTFVEGVNKASVVKQASDIQASSVKVLNCHDSMIYVLAPLNYATVNGCSDATIVLGAVGKAVRVEHCERVNVIVATMQASIANCRECIFFLGVNKRPIISGNNHNLQVAPYNTFYRDLEIHLAQVRVDPTINMWDKSLALGMVDPHDSLSHPAGSDGQAESASFLHPDRFLNFVIPKWFEVESPHQQTKQNPFILPKPYMAGQQQKSNALEDMRQCLRNSHLEDNKKQELAGAIHSHFKEWLYASGNIRQLYCLQNTELDSTGID
uniref:TBCC domain-containing protein 1 n=1 Tax=Wollemia nobilis TaxID=56998 RepID=A0A0C9RYC3_9CONI